MVPGGQFGWSINCGCLCPSALTTLYFLCYYLGRFFSYFIFLFNSISLSLSLPLYLSVHETFLNKHSKTSINILWKYCWSVVPLAVYLLWILYSSNDKQVWHLFKFLIFLDKMLLSPWWQMNKISHWG